MLTENLEYDKLAALGLQIWQPRAFRHPNTLSQATLFDSPQVRINARCLVVLYFAHLTQVQMSEAEQKILAGMISVLNLPAEQIMQVNIYSLAPDLNLINKTLAQYRADTVLQLGMDCFPLDLPNCIRTFSPQYLSQNPQHKAQAFKDLLSLRKILDA